MEVIVRRQDWEHRASPIWTIGGRMAVALEIRA